MHVLNSLVTFLLLTTNTALYPEQHQEKIGGGEFDDDEEKEEITKIRNANTKALCSPNNFFIFLLITLFFGEIDSPP